MKRAGQFLVSLVGVLIPLLPKGACPLCLGAYGAVLSTLGLGFLATERALAPLVVIALVLAVGSVALATRVHGRAGPLAIAILGAGAVLGGRILWHVPVLLYAGLTILFGASLWNLWLKRPLAAAPLIQIGSAPTQGERQ